MTSEDRESKLKPSEPFQELSETERAPIEARNAIEQFDLLKQLIEQGLDPSRAFRLRVSALNRLNEKAVKGLVRSPGALRTEDISIIGSKHTPPAWQDLQQLMEEMCDYVNDNWSTASALHLSAYVMWRLNWIHPYPDGNGRTSRAASYLVLSVRTGYVLPGEVTIPEQIAASKRSYYHALDAADAAFRGGSSDLHEMEELLKGCLANQLLQVVQAASGKGVSPSEPPGPAWNND